MYSYLAKHVAKLDGKAERAVAVEAIRSQSLWACGSSAMPLPLIRQWKALSGSYPLERYGMTETGMILGNPLEPTLRRPGTVGLPFPGMEVDIREDGQLWCRGRQVRIESDFVVLCCSLLFFVVLSEFALRRRCSSLHLLASRGFFFLFSSFFSCSLFRSSHLWMRARR